MTSTRAPEIEAVATGLNRLQRLMSSRRVFARLAATAGLSLAQQATQVLLALDDGQHPIGELAAAAHMDVGAVSRQLPVLEAEGLVTRAPSPAHGKIVLVRLTRRGRALADQIRDVRARHLTDALASWPAADREQLGVLLNRLVTDLQAAPYRPLW